MIETLAKHLLIQSPSEITQSKIWSQLEKDYMSSAPPFRFRRSREVNATALNWIAELFDGDAADNWRQKNAVQSIRYLLENIWVSNPEAARDTVAIRARNNIKDYPPAAGIPPEHEDWLPQLFCPLPGGGSQELAPGSVIAVAHPNGSLGAARPKIVLYYLLETEDDDGFSAESFPNDGDAQRYDDTWQSRVHSVKRVYPQDEEQRSEHEFIDLGVGAILQRYPFLNSERSVNVKLRDKLEGILEGEDNYVKLRAFSSEVQGLNQEISRLRRSVSTLIGYAASKGYTLLDQPRPVTPIIRGVKQAEKNYQPGDMFQTTRFVTRWVEEHIVHRSRRRFLRSTKRWTEVHRVNRSAETVEYKKVESQDSILSDFIQYDLKGQNVAILQSVAGGYEAEDGRSLSSILDRCDIDPLYQKTCVLLMPVYRQSLFGEDVIAGYHVIRRPKRGRRIVAMPEFYLEEQISYKLRWLGMELGELVSSINLLPGEVRDISIKTTRSSLRENELKSTQNFEAESSNSYDTISSVENEFQRENTSEKTKSWSVKASGSYGAFSAGGSASGTSKKTARQFAKSLNKLTTQAISKMRKSSRSEIVARELSREELEAVSSSSGQVSNPNVGRTMNVNYFAINNVFASATYLEDIGFSYISPFELIDGTDIRDVRTFSKEELPEFLDSVAADIARMIEMGLEFRPELAEAGALPTRAEMRAKAGELATGFVTKLRKDFLNTIKDYSSEVAASEETMEIEPVEAFMVKTAEAEMRAFDPSEDVDLNATIKRFVATGRPIEPDLVISPSAAVYADASTGATEGLETYAVDMRKLEVEKQLADVITSMTERDAKLDTSIRTHHNVSHSKTGDAELTIEVGGTVQPGTWSYRIGASIIGTLEITEGVSRYRMALDATAPSDVMIAQMPGSLVRYV